MWGKARGFDKTPKRAARKNGYLDYALIICFTSCFKLPLLVYISGSTYVQPMQYRSGSFCPCETEAAGLTMESILCVQFGSLAVPTRE